MQRVLFPVAPSAPIPDPISYSDTDSMVHFCQNGKCVQSSSVPEKTIYWVSSSFTAFVNHIYRLIDWLTDWLPDWLTGRLIDWLTDWVNARDKRSIRWGDERASHGRSEVKYTCFMLVDGIRTGNTVLGSSQDLPDFPSRIGNRKMKTLGMMTWSKGSFIYRLVLWVHNFVQFSDLYDKGTNFDGDEIWRSQKKLGTITWNFEPISAFVLSLKFI
jgi:hypothetical protein